MSEHLQVNAVEIKNHRPIPFGLLKVVAALCLCIIVGFLTIHLQVFTKPWHAGMSGVFVMFVLTVIWALVARKSLGSIGDRNLNGYALWIWLDEKFEKRWDLVLECGEITRYPEGLDLTRTRVALRLGLKGGGDVYVREYGDLRVSEHWSVNLVRVNDLNGIVIVRLRDDMGGCISEITADNVFRLLDWPLKLQDIPREQWLRLQKTYQTTVSGLMQWFMISDRVGEEAVAKAKELEGAVAGLEAQLIGDLVELIERLRATSRFKSSIEGRRIRKELLTKALKLLSPDDPRRGGLAVQLEEIESNEAREYANTRRLIERGDKGA